MQTMKDDFSTIRKTTNTISGRNGIWRVPPEICAKQMKIAFAEVIEEKYAFPTSWKEAQIRHQLLYSSDFKDIQYSQ
jgi:hypothetical protein